MLIEFMGTFQQHHNSQQNQKSDSKITLAEFLEYYNFVSCNIENDSYFDTMITNAWQLDNYSNPANLPFAGVSKKI